MSGVPLGGLQRFGLSDYPGRAAATIFTQGCDFRCPFCHNGGLIARQRGAPRPDDGLWDFLEARRATLGGVVVSGGEPTIHDGLPGLVGRLRALGYVVKLDTNGSRPGMLLRLLKAGLVDYVAMDVKAPLRADAYRRLAGVEVSVAAIDESIRLIADSGAPHEFRTTYVPALHDVDDIGRIRESLPPGSLHRVQRFRPKHALDPRLRVPCPAGSDMPSDPDPRDSRSWTGAAGPRSRGAAGGARRVAGSAQESVAT